MSNSCIWPRDRTLSGATTLSQSGAGSNGNKEVLHIPQSSKAGASLSDYLVSYPGLLLVVWSSPSAEMQSVYSTSPADWALKTWIHTHTNSLQDGRVKFHFKKGWWDTRDDWLVGWFCGMSTLAGLFKAEISPFC